MNNTALKWEKIKNIFAAALEQSEDLRATFLSEACRDDSSLLEEVRSLLGAHDAPENLVEKNALNLTAPGFDNRNYTGQLFGNYRIVGEIGRGGMGMVYLAERADGEFEQQVALKIVRQTFLEPKLEARFRRERQILASLNHPNIAKLLDGGVSAGDEPFLAMEYIDGEPINRYVARHNLTLDETLELFLKVCAAISYSHRHLIVHRDVKPSNILISREGEPKLLDFGLAEILKDNLFEASRTETYFRAFTPAYASPEQIEGKRVTTATDVYSLGVILYELLTGARPNNFERQNYEEIVRSVQTLEPPLPPSSVVSERQAAGDTLVSRDRQTAAKAEDTAEDDDFKPLAVNPKLLRGDLDNIVLKALRKEPERRYESVESFAQDIRRHLNNLPVAARPDTVSYRLGKFLARNKIVVAAAIFVVLTLAGGLTVALWQAQVARLQAARAEKRFQDVRQLSNSLLFDIAPKIEKLPGALDARQTVVNQSLKYLDSLAAESQDDLNLQAELAAAYEKIGDLQGNPSNPNFIDLDSAVKSYETAQQLRRRIYEKDSSDVEASRKLAENYYNLGSIYSQSNEADKSRENTLSALQIYERLVAAQPDDFELQYAQARVSYDFGVNLSTAKKYDDSRQYFDAAKNSLKRLHERNPARKEVTEILAEAKIQDAFGLSWMEKQTEAEAEAKEAIELYEALFAQNPDDLKVRAGMWLTYWLTSNIYQDVNDPLAYEYSVKALNVVRETVAKDPANVRAKQQLAKSYSTLGEMATVLNKPSEALQSLENASRMQGEIIDTTATKNSRLKSDLALTLTRLGAAKTKQGDFSGALKSLEQSREIYLKLLESNPNDRRSNRNLALTYEQIAETYEKLSAGNSADSNRQAVKTNYQSALEILERLASQNMLAEVDRKFLEEMRTKAGR